MTLPFTLAYLLVAIHTPAASNADSNATTPDFSEHSRSYKIQDLSRATPEERTIVCRNVTTLRTKIPKQICRSKAEWDKFSANDRQVMEKFQRRF
jgi:hypothetical protein